MNNVATSNYEGLQAKIEKRFSKGLTFRLNYSFSKTMDVGGIGLRKQLFAAEPK